MFKLFPYFIKKLKWGCLFLFPRIGAHCSETTLQKQIFYHIFSVDSDLSLPDKPTVLSIDISVLFASFFLQLNYHSCLNSNRSSFKIHSQQGEQHRCLFFPLSLRMFRVGTNTTWSVCHLATTICPTCKFSRSKAQINKRGTSPWGLSCCIASSMFKDREGPAVGPSVWHHKVYSPYRSRLAPRRALTASCSWRGPETPGTLLCFSASS